MIGLLAVNSEVMMAPMMVDSSLSFVRWWIPVVVTFSICDIVSKPGKWCFRLETHKAHTKILVASSLWHAHNSEYCRFAR